MRLKTDNQEVHGVGQMKEIKILVLEIYQNKAIGERKKLLELHEDLQDLGLLLHNLLQLTGQDLLQSSLNQSLNNTVIADSPLLEGKVKQLKIHHSESQQLWLFWKKLWKHQKGLLSSSQSDKERLLQK